MMFLKRKKITTKQINECINLLHKDYQGDYKIKVYKTKLSYVVSMLFNKKSTLATYEDLSNTTAGQFNRYTNQIEIYYFKYHRLYQDEGNNKYDFMNLHCIDVIFHELKHYYQWNYQRLRYWNEFQFYGYFSANGLQKSLQIERGANNFCRRMMEKYHNQISSILNMNYEWLTI